MSDSLGFDVAAGISESALNALLPKIYKALYPTCLKDTIKVDEVGISSVTFDIQAPPAISLATSETATAHTKSSLENLLRTHQATLSAAHKSAILDVASSASYVVTAPKVALTVNYSNGSPSTKIPSASLEAHATVSVEGTKSELTFKILSGTIDIPSDSTLTQLLNRALLPYLIEDLNKNIFTAIKIPPLGYKSLKFSAPLPVVSQSLLAAFSSLGSTPPAIPGPLPWPQDGLFIAADIATLEAAANLVFPLGPQQNFSWNIFSGHVGATLSEPKVTNIADDGTISASIEANASCQLTMDTPSPLPNLSLGPSATASLGCSLRPSVDGGELKVTIASIPSIKFSFDWGIPSWINWLFDPLEEGLATALNATLGSLIGDALKNLPIPILDVPSIPIELGGKKITINIDQATPSGIQGTLLVVKTQTNVQ